LKAKIQAQESLTVKAKDYEREIDRLKQKRSTLQVDIQQQNSNWKKRFRAHQGLQQLYLSSKFPELPDVARYVFSSLLAMLAVLFVVIESQMPPLGFIVCWIKELSSL